MTKSLTFRAANQQDTKAVTLIFNEIVLEGKSFLSDTTVSYEELKHRITHEESCSYLALYDNEIVGFYMIRPNQKGRGNHICNATYGIKKEFRSLGFGYQLAKHSLKKAIDLNFVAMQFNSVVASNTASIRLWRKLGFEQIGRIPNGFKLKDGNYEDTLIFFMQLKKLGK